MVREVSEARSREHNFPLKKLASVVLNTTFW